MSDPRFARLKTDPRFRRPRTKQSKVVVDGRFKGIFDSGKKQKGSKGNASDLVDKYGRPISSTREKDNLRRFYRLETEDQTSDGEPKLADYARGEVLLESSDEEDDVNVARDNDSDAEDIVTLGQDASKPISVREDEYDEIDLDESTFADLDAQAADYAKTHPEDQREGGERTRRIAVVNLDWDHVRAVHLYKIFSSLVSPTAPVTASSSSSHVHPDRQRYVKGGKSTVVRGNVLSLRVYTSEFGKERLAREETEGPPVEVFKGRKSVEDEEINEKNIYEVGGEDDYDEDALRKYQLERLRYYYAIATCDTVDTASHIYSELDGTELERSANVFDLSFVPDEMEFDEVMCHYVRSEATADKSSNYKGVDFVTDALRHSKVKLTWDDDDPERNQITRRTLSRQEIEEADFKAYLASSTSGSESEADHTRKPNTKSTKDKKVSERDKLRALLLDGGNDGLPEGWGRADGDEGDDVDMEITFTPGLSGAKDGDETTLEKYQRKTKERRKTRKNEIKEKPAKKDDEGRGSGFKDDFFDNENWDKAELEAGRSQKADDKNRQKLERRKASPGPSSRPLATPEELALLVTSDNPNKEPKHFDLKSVLKSEKKSKVKRQKGRKSMEDHEIQEDFAIDVKDERFKALHEDHTFAIDPSSPHFRKTKGMAALLEERSKRQKDVGGNETSHFATKRPTKDSETNWKSLVESVKRKTTFIEQSGFGKRRKL